MKSLIPLAALVLCAMTSRVATASLGDDVTSVEADRVHMKAAAIATSRSALYTVHEMQAAGGTTVREFASADGIVFAVTWKGPFKPDLRQALGRYFQAYQDAPRAKRQGHSHDVVEQPGLIVHSSGRMRAFVGIAYVPQLVPAGVSVDQLEGQSFQ